MQSTIPSPQCKENIETYNSCRRSHEMEKNEASWCPTVKYELPSEEAGCCGEQGCYGRTKEIVIRHSAESIIVAPPGDQVEHDAREEQRDGEMDEHDMLSMFGQKNILEIK